MKSTAFAAALLFGAVVGEPFNSGEVKTHEKYRYGRFKTRMQASDKSGTVSSFFTYWEGEEGLPWSVEHWNEIDVEIVPKISQAPFATNIIYAWRQMDPEKVQNFQPGNQYHTYQIDWTPDYIAWWLDGIKIRHVQGEPSQQDIKKSKSLFMNFWTPEFSSWGGPADELDTSSMPWYALYDYVEVYDYNFTTRGFDFRWRDDFNTLNEDRWRVSNGWSFEQNSSRFLKNNVYVENGKLVLKMEKNDYESLPVDNGTYAYSNWQCIGENKCSDCSPGQACHKRYPFGDPLKFKSPDAECACLPQQRAPAGYSFKDKNSTKVTKGTCDGCTDCAVSYPKDDPLGLKSAEKLLRCKSDFDQKFTYGWDLNCGQKYDGDCGADCMFCLWSYPQGDPAKFGSENAACRCPPQSIQELTWGDRCPSADHQDCGGYCRDCQWSWKTYSENSNQARCRCKNWW